MNNAGWQGKSILVVDDSIFIQNDLKLVFQEVGLNIVGVCGDGSEAINLYKSEKPDFVSLDIIMPGIHGISCYREIKKIDPDAQCFFVSCLSSNNRFTVEFDSEIEKSIFLPKPLKTEVLEAFLNRTYQVHEATEEKEELPQPA